MRLRRLRRKEVTVVSALPSYLGNKMSTRHTVARVQTGVRMERRILLVLRALAASLGMSTGDLLEGIVLHAFEGQAPFGPDSLAKVRALRDAFGLELTAADSHLLVDRNAKRVRKRKG